MGTPSPDFKGKSGIFGEKPRQDGAAFPKDQEQPEVPPQVLHFMQVPLRTSV